MTLIKCQFCGTICAELSEAINSKEKPHKISEYDKVILEHPEYLNEWDHKTTYFSNDLLLNFPD